MMDDLVNLVADPGSRHSIAAMIGFIGGVIKQSHEYYREYRIVYGNGEIKKRSNLCSEMYGPASVILGSGIAIGSAINYKNPFKNMFYEVAIDIAIPVMTYYTAKVITWSIGKGVRTLKK